MGYYYSSNCETSCLVNKKVSNCLHLADMVLYLACHIVIDTTCHIMIDATNISMGGAAVTRVLSCKAARHTDDYCRVLQVMVL